MGALTMFAFGTCTGTCACIRIRVSTCIRIRIRTHIFMKPAIITCSAKSAIFIFAQFRHLF